MAVSPVQAADNYMFGRCALSIPNLGASIWPIYDGDSYLTGYHDGDSRYQGFSFDSNDVKVTLVKAPTHGKVVLEEGQWSGIADYHYTPNDSYVGQDRFVMQVEKNGIKVRIQYLIENVAIDEPITYIDSDGQRKGHFCNPDAWKISTFFTTPTLDNFVLQSLLGAAAIDGGTAVNFADLTGSAVGQTTGAGPTNQVTLDTDAAGHGWFIDYTPYLNDEYLTTSDPNVWIAREGSEAAGRMDMLSVLLHEYGHALGLENSSDAGDFMATTLQAGERRLPSASELELMAQLLGLAKETGNASSVPYNPFSPPGTPLPMTVSLAAFIADRQRRSSLSSALTQFEAAANPTLTNPQFADSQGWSTTGEVAIGAGAATLKETSTSQTRLNQAFVIGQNDRFLFFTLTGIALDDLNNAPDDAFM